MIENCIGMLSLPLGLGLNFLINNIEYSVPMVIEEPSVIAAVSGSAKIIKEHGAGFKTWSSEPLMIGQIQVLDVDPVIGIISRLALRLRDCKFFHSPHA
jgi:degradative hydroxymethylglutaryl-CoA reductase